MDKRKIIILYIISIICLLLGYTYRYYLQQDLELNQSFFHFDLILLFFFSHLFGLVLFGYFITISAISEYRYKKEFRNRVLSANYFIVFAYILFLCYQALSHPALHEEGSIFFLGALQGPFAIIITYYILKGLTWKK